MMLIFLAKIAHPLIKVKLPCHIDGATATTYIAAGGSKKQNVKGLLPTICFWDAESATALYISLRAGTRAVGRVAELRPAGRCQG